MRVLSRLLKIIGIRKDQVKILCLGLDSVGKTTVIKAIRGQESMHHAPATTLESIAQSQQQEERNARDEDNSSEDSEAREQNVNPENQKDDTLTPPHTHTKRTGLASIVPTLGFQVEIFQRQNVQFTVFDMSGQGKYRDMWSFFFKDCMGVLYVIDSADRERISTVRDEIQQLTHNKDLRNKPFVFLCNKQDLPGVMSVEECVELIGLQDEQIEWHIIPTKAIENEGLNEATNWLVDRMLA
uniref:ADP-ribosylation factor-like protein 6 n=1 Tax=Percolomonas cosmopolitus TaxID=63605 RepID=A0A7S1KMW5_9EUKA|mmetsp:Transcript_2207/g.8108  ORF Transcript_2207/g.8108 Transcript_2207/m.8108 type:complete len:241 (+) Transcript_2207:295-1017(+)|eukprot:CAMPEP_0117439978 /NCGR_PEP_ID=MMETSP0759-20121206/2839_1 /TAXON_ID=63605 /ORGANISM="Percolomonas cosmopolitus, Strain WS" /LENGTH=240 /DNA_ID=CAMNT_0005231701 /DNA_START=265 /DNA_END=987 /DNA_ORIENTATION=-